MNNKEITNYLVKNIRNDVLIQVYHSKWSTYIRFDGGVCNSLRISNHKSPKEHLNYMFNLRSDLDTVEQSVIRGNYTQYFYGMNELDELVNHINANIDTRRNMLIMYGADYRKQVEDKLFANTPLNRKLKTVQHYEFGE